MSTSKEEERFNKAIEIYIKKYQLTVYSLIKFIEEKISLSSELKDVVTAQILKYKSREASINKHELKMYLHLVAAAQSKIDVRGKNIESFHQNFRLTFIENKGKEEGRSGEEGRAQGKAESRPEIKKERDNKKQQEMKIEEEIKKEKSEQVAGGKSVPEPVKEVPMKKRQSRAEVPLSPKKQLQIIQEDVIDENRVSNLTYKQQNTQEVLLKIPQAQMMSIKSKKSVQITGYDKFGQNFLKSIFKYHIVFQGREVDRRYSEFQRLMNDLGRRYQGFILPELPPKQGLKSNLTYFSGVNEQFLNDRQHKLQEMLNCLVNSKSINKDQILKKFLTDQDFEIETSNQGGFFEYFKWFIDLLSNTKEMKIYASAWFQFKKGFNRADISTSATLKYKEIEELLNFCLEIDHYRNAINSNFERRRDIFKELNLDKNDRNLAITKFDHLSSCSASQIKNLRKEVEKYLDLKTDESWLNYLIKEKEGDSDSNIDQLKKGRDDFVGRVTTMEHNLINSIQELKAEKLEYLQSVGDNMMQWRSQIHP